ncbi:phosphate ABC transporter permease subunit PstC [Gottfriedia solisilvae]|uniref:Phosphate transport system permease protein n=1 Tax=Gottfriedia solisilvae TaxID=1516104 RepID=A0A8J3AIF2_9BACI|nr:phosphate ABC transporter permease subunit PstC [Gottfriedia solisilvae]GGI15072.1 phosphate transport system permease protein [Gottfriedia solisilvae]
MAIPQVEISQVFRQTQKKTTFQSTIFNRSFLIACFCSSLILGIILFTIVYFIGKTGIHVFHDVSFKEFFLSFKWEPYENHFGAGSFIIGTLSLTALTLLFTVPISLSIAIFNTQFAPVWLRNFLSLTLDILVGIPSIVYGYIGLTLLIPLIRDTFQTGLGSGLLAASLVLTLMCIPTVVKISEDSFMAVPNDLKDASYALGSTHFQMIRRVLIPASSSGVTTAIILGMARAIGETMAVVMVIGNTAQIAKSLTMPTSVLTSNIVMEILNVSYDSTWNYALYMMAFILLCISLLLIIIIRNLRKKGA